MEIRVITPEHLDELRHIFSHSFYRGAPVDLTAEQLGERAPFGVFDRGRLQASLVIHDFEMFFRKDRRPCGGIAGVACEPAARGRGYAGALLRHSLETMHERGQYLSSLWPFSFAYYRAFGWEWTGVMVRHRLPTRVLRSFPEAENVEAVTTDIGATLNPAYEAFATQMNGQLVRSAKRWERQLRPWNNRSAATYLYREEGQALGYAVVRHRDREGHASAELGFVNMRAFRGLLGLLHRQAMTIETLRIMVPAKEPFWSTIRDWDVRTDLEAAGMGRIVDVRAALEAVRPDPELRGEAILSVVDPHAPWNERAWRIRADSGSVECAPTDSTPGVALDIQALTQAYWGDPSLGSLRACERLDVTRESDFVFLSRLFPPSVACMYDDF